MRLIDADALDIAKEVETACKAMGFAEKSGFEALVTGWLMGAIAEAPTISAAPVARGEWVVDECDTTDDVPSFSWIDFHCSECNTDYGLEEGQYGWCRYEKIPYRYCPNCGAKMESEGGT